jgi:predicted nucleic acid-binding protein
MGRRPGNKEMERKQKVKTRPRVLDTSVVVKWFSSADEKDLEKSLMLRQEHIDNPGLFVIPDLLYYELANALRYNPRFSLNTDFHRHYKRH